MYWTSYIRCPTCSHRFEFRGSGGAGFLSFGQIAPHGSAIACPKCDRIFSLKEAKAAGCVEANWRELVLPPLIVSAVAGLILILLYLWGTS